MSAEGLPECGYHELRTKLKATRKSTCCQSPAYPISGEGPDCRAPPLVAIAREARSPVWPAPAQSLGSASFPSLQDLSYGQHGRPLYVLWSSAFPSARSHD